MTKLLIFLHVGAGSVALVGMLVAFLSKKGSQQHRYGGRAYVAGMGLSLLAATVIAVFTANYFLLTIGLFSAYLVYTGMRLAQVKNGVMSQLDSVLSKVMLLVCVIMIVYGTYMLFNADSLGVALIAFGILASVFARQDILANGQWPKGKERINLHLSRMGGAIIATLTAVFVVNVQTTPAFIAWLLPTVVITPVLIYLGRKNKA